MTVLDLSNYDADTLGVDCMEAEGVTGVILGCQRPDVARRMAKALTDGGIPVIGVYAFLYLGIDSTGQTANAIAVAKAFSVRRVWLDVESTGEHEREGITPDERIAQVRDCVAMVQAAGLLPGIYTGRWYWVPEMANTAEFSHLPLWHSEYPNDGHEIRTVNYGGWTKVAVHQYTSERWVCGRNRDANYVFEEDEDVELTAKVARLERIVAGNKVEGTCYPGTEDLFPLGTPVTPEGEEGQRYTLTGEDALEYCDRRGFSLTLGVGLARRSLVDHVREGHPRHTIPGVARDGQGE